ncbi:MAG: glycosyltransferase [Candidatus Scalinduaceae bacterium]
MMKLVHFISGKKNQIADYLVTPVRYNKRALFKKGYKVKIVYEPSEKNLNCDILCLVSKPVLEMLNEKDSVCVESGPTIPFIKKAREYANKIIWMDISDSTSVTHFELLLYVDLYLKKHLLKDKSLYQKEFYGGRIFTDYYHNKFGIEDSSPFNQFFPLDMNLAHKVDLSWNMGIGDAYNAFSKKNAVRRRFPDYIPASYKVPYTSPTKKRELDIFIRASTLRRETVAFHRRELVKRLEGMLQSDNTLRGSANGRLPLKTYREMMKNTKIAFGPFGWGELNIREYEALIFGALLLRPDFSHMETWPSTFIVGETCVTYRWDFEDLESTIREYLRDEKRRLQIAQNGQEAFRNSISPSGMEKFCDWFIQQIEK